MSLIVFARAYSEMASGSRIKSVKQISLTHGLLNNSNMPLYGRQYINFFLLWTIVFTNKDTDDTSHSTPDHLCKPSKIIFFASWESSEDVNLQISTYVHTSNIFVLPMGKLGGEKQDLGALQAMQGAEAKGY